MKKTRDRNIGIFKNWGKGVCMELWYSQTNLNTRKDRKTSIYMNLILEDTKVIKQSQH